MNRLGRAAVNLRSLIHTGDKRTLGRLFLHTGFNKGV